MGAGQQDKESLKKYIRIALVTFVTFCCCTLFFFVIYRYHGFAVYWQKLMKILQPIIIGFIVAYLINPVMVFIEKHLMLFLEPRMKSKKKAKKAARAIGTAGALLFLLLIIFLLLDMMIPELIKSVQNMMVSLPAEVNSFSAWINETLAEDSQLADMLGSSLVKVTNVLENFISCRR